MAANFGSAFTPFGNTHNIFLMSHYTIGIGEFFSWSIPLLIASIILLLGFTLFVKKIPLPAVGFQDIHIQTRPTVITAIVALFIFAGVLKFIPSYIGAVAAILLAVLYNKTIMKKSRLRNCPDLRRLLRHCVRLAAVAVGGQPDLWAGQLAALRLPDFDPHQPANF